MKLDDKRKGVQNSMPNIARVTLTNGLDEPLEHHPAGESFSVFAPQARSRFDATPEITVRAGHDSIP
ncbi:hypothetical protein VTO42DRAFT_2826 [Malbranchea cinnamomea]